MINRAELENKLVHEIHYLPIEAIETMLQLALLMKKTNPTQSTEKSDNFTQPANTIPLLDIEPSLSVGAALKKFLKKYESESIDIDTSIFDRDRPQESGRDITL